MPSVDLAIQYAHKHHHIFVETLKEVLRIPSVSTDPDHNQDMKKTASWLAAQLARLSFAGIEIFPTLGHPVVYGEIKAKKANCPTVLVYGHYDVQPAEPLEMWETGAFDPEIRNDYLFARGSSDMKGQILAVFSALESIFAKSELAVNIKMILEGEEEIGSPNVALFLQEHKDLLQCDFVLNPDAGIIAPDQPSIVYALRGLAYFELRVFGPAHDLHSGVFGGLIHNPAIAICELIAGMHDEHGRVTLPGFYDSVRPLSKEERVSLGRLPLPDSYYLENTGSSKLKGEDGYTPVEQVGARPTLDVNGLLSGFTGSGSKTVIPAWAMAKISMRLVPDQNPEDVYQQLKSYLELRAPDTIHWELTSLSGGLPCATDTNHPAALALARAMETVWGIPPVFKREGGSIPIVTDMQTILGRDSVLTGFGLPDDNIHAPNERLHLPTWYKGIDALIYFFHEISTY